MTPHQNGPSITAPRPQPETAQTVTDAWLVIPLFNEAAVVRQVIDNARRTFPHVICRR